MKKKVWIPLSGGFLVLSLILVFVLLIPAPIMAFRYGPPEYYFIFEGDASHKELVEMKLTETTISPIFTDLNITQGNYDYKLENFLPQTFQNQSNFSLYFQTWRSEGITVQCTHYPEVQINSSWINNSIPYYDVNWGHLKYSEDMPLIWVNQTSQAALQTNITLSYTNILWIKVHYFYIIHQMNGLSNGLGYSMYMIIEQNETVPFLALSEYIGVS